MRRASPSPLPRGASALAPERVAHLQRERLLVAFTALCARRGYARATVALVVAEAGVSRATFYEHFRNREDCCRAAFRRAVARLRDELVPALEASPPGERLPAALGALLRALAADPAAAQLVLVEALGAERTVRAEREALGAEAVRALADLLTEEDGGEAFQAPTAALLGGVTGVLSRRLLGGEGTALESLEPELLVWLRSYRLLAGARPLPTSRWAELGAGLASGRAGQQPAAAAKQDPGALPPGDPQRERIVAAVARLSRQKGYVAMTVADIVSAASVARGSFYGCFGGKQDAFAATQEAGLRDSAAAAAAAFFTIESWPDRVWVGLDAALSYIARQPDLACVDLIESYAVGHAAIRRSIDNRMAFTVFLEEGYRQRPEAAALPRLCSEAVSAAVLELLRREVVARGAEQVRALLPQASYMALAPFMGPAEALAAVEAKLA